MSRLYMISKVIDSPAISQLLGLLSRDDQLLLRSDGVYLLKDTHLLKQLLKLGTERLLVLREDAIARAIDIPSTVTTVNNYQALVAISLDHTNTCDWVV